jgi:hypothetical protein
LALPAYGLSVQSHTLQEARAALRPQSRFSAEAQARAVVSELYAMALRVDAMARDPEVLSLIEHGSIGRGAPALRRHAAGFDSVNVFSADGSHQARWPAAPENAASNTGHARFFACARELSRKLLTQAPRDADLRLPVCVAGAHLSRIDGKVKLGISAPLLASGRLLGVVEASTMARDRFGALQMDCGPGDCFTALLGARDRDAPGRPIPGVLSVLAQRGVPLGGEVRLPLELSRMICEKLGCVPEVFDPFGRNESEPLQLDPYVDPITNARTAAVIAPVARTGLSVLIATPYSATHSHLADIAGAALRHVWLPPLIGVVVWLLVLFAPNPRWPWPSRAGSSIG